MLGFGVKRGPGCGSVHGTDLGISWETGFAPGKPQPRARRQSLTPARRCCLKCVYGFTPQVGTEEASTNLWQQRGEALKHRVKRQM